MSSDHLSEFCAKVEKKPAIQAIRDGLVMIIPIIMVGCFALILESLPITPYQNFIHNSGHGMLYVIFNALYNVTFGALSLYMSFTIAYCYSKENNTPDHNIFGPPIVSMGMFLIMIGFLSDTMIPASLGSSSVFLAMLSAVLGTTAYNAMEESLKKHHIFSDGADIRFNQAVCAIVPSLIILLVFAFVKYIICQIFHV